MNSVRNKLTDFKLILGLLSITAGSAFGATSYLNRLAKAQDVAVLVQSLQQSKAEIEVLKESQRNTEKTLDRLYLQLQEVARSVGANIMPPLRK